MPGECSSPKYCEQARLSLPIMLRLAAFEHPSEVSVGAVEENHEPPVVLSRLRLDFRRVISSSAPSSLGCSGGSPSARQGAPGVRVARSRKHLPACSGQKAFSPLAAV